jgi:hypothetical protein
VRDLTGPQRATVTTAVEQLAWTMARELLELEPGAGPRPDLPDADLRQMWLAALRSLLAIRDSAEQLAASAALSAAQHGADYPAIGDAAGMTRQGARRKWPGLAGLSDERQRKLSWWNGHEEQFARCVQAVLATAEGQPEQPRLANLRARLAEIEEASPAQRLDAFDWLLVDAHAVGLGTPTPIESAAARAIGLLAALTADAYAATNSHSSLVIHDNLACGANGCSSSPMVGLLCPDIGHVAVPACRQHAIEALRQPDNRIVTAYQADVALSVFTEAYGDDAED